MKCLASVLIVAFFVSAPIGDLIGTRTCLASQEISEFYSFENDMEGWSINGTDLNPNDPTADEWAITRSQDMAFDGSTSVKLDLTNNNDQGKIWIEKPFFVEPNRLYQVSVSYSFASPNADIGNFTIMTGVLKRPPTTRYDLIPTYKEDTGKASSTPGYIWLDKRYEFTVPSDQTGSLYIVIGIWGTFEVRQRYYVDSVRVEIAPKPEGSQFYSFESDMDGWSANAADVVSGEWSISRDAEIRAEGSTSVKLDLNNVNGKGKLWIARPFAVEPGRKYRVSLDYAFSSRTSADFRIIAGVFRTPPLDRDDLSSAYQDDTTRIMFWFHKSYHFTIKSKKSSTVYVAIGAMGTEQTHREYFIDSVCITLTKK